MFWISIDASVSSHYNYIGPLPNTNCGAVMNFYLPESLDLNFIKPLYRPAIQWLVNSIYMMKTMRKMRKDDYAPLRSKIMQKFMGDSYKSLLEQLAVEGVLESDGKYEVGRKSFGYRLAEPYRHATHRLVPVTAHVMLKRIEAWHRSLQATWSDVHHRLKLWMERMKLTVDPKDWPGSELMIARIQNQDFWFVVCRYGRVHTPATSLKRGLRRYLRIEGQPLVEIDIANSQPLMLALLMQERGITTPDALAYRSLCEQGQLYGHLMESQGVPTSERREYKRKVIGQVLYCKNSDQDNPLSIAFGKMFPSVMKVIKDTKRQGYRHLPRHMQRKESDIMIRDVCGRLTREHPQVPVLSIHDSLMTTRSHVALAQRIIHEEFAKLGITPTLNVKEPR